MFDSSLVWSWSHIGNDLIFVNAELCLELQVISECNPWCALIMCCLNININVEFIHATHDSLSVTRSSNDMLESTKLCTGLHPDIILRLWQKVLWIMGCGHAQGLLLSAY